METRNGQTRPSVIIVQTPMVNKNVESAVLSKIEPKHMLWNEAMKVHLVSSCLANKAYKKTNINFDKKWEFVAANLQIKPEFHGFELSGPNMKRKFDRLKADVESKYSLEGMYCNILLSICNLKNF